LPSTRPVHRKWWPIKAFNALGRLMRRLEESVPVGQAFPT